MSGDFNPTTADIEIRKCLTNRRSFSMVAGAGSGKTTSLVMALEYLRENEASWLRRNGQKIVCITYTKRAVKVISGRLGYDNLYIVATLHGFLWGEICRFNHDMREVVRDFIIPMCIEREREKDKGRQTKSAIKARAKIARLEEQLAALDVVRSFDYDDGSFSDYANGQFSHDDVIDVAGHLLTERPILRRVLGQKYPFIFVDEAQDTFLEIIAGLNLVNGGEGLPIVGYFGDPMQQIYDKRAGEFAGPPGSARITKEENYRCSISIIDLLNAFRQDVQQVPAGDNAGVVGSVRMTLIRAEEPEAHSGNRRVYSEEQLQRALDRFDAALADWGWNDGREMKQLFLVRQMIARRLGFLEVHRLFTGPFASSRAQDEYEKGTHFLLKSFIEVIWPLVKAHRDDNHRSIIDILRSKSPTFDIRGVNSERPLRDMVDLSKKLATSLSGLWEKGTLREVLTYCQKNGLAKLPSRLEGHIARAPRAEEYNDDEHTEDKADWLCDEFFSMGTSELQAYCEFVEDNTVYSTQHGVKGEEYQNVLVVFDDVEAAWTMYSFTKLLTPQVAGKPTEGQFDRSRKLAYVCFSRAEENLRIILFTLNPEAAVDELIEGGLLTKGQISIIE